MTEVELQSCWTPLLACFCLSGIFVGSLYIWNSKFDRNHPVTIKKRFCSVFTVILISPFILKIFLTSAKLKKFSVLELIGIRTSGFIPAAVLPLIVTMILFLGPISMLDFFDLWHSVTHPQYWLDNLTNLIWIRNILIGPLAEEFVFRACMIPLLLQCYKPTTVTFICSLFFGIAHIHHIVERYKAGVPYHLLAIRTFFQFFYTTIFGAYSAFLFIQTGHFVAPFVVHAFCNVLGFPDFNRIFYYENPKKIIIIFLFILGIILWYMLLNPLLNHEFYENYVYFGNKNVP